MFPWATLANHFIKSNNAGWVVAIAPWFVCAYHPAAPGFESQAHHLCFFQFVLLKLYQENNENKQKEAGIGPYFKYLLFVGATNYLQNSTRPLKLELSLHLLITFVNIIKILLTKSFPEQWPKLKSEYSRPQRKTPAVRLQHLDSST